MAVKDINNSVMIRSLAICSDNEEYIWFASNSDNLIFKMSYKSNDIEYVTSTEEMSMTSFLYVGAKYYNGKVFFFPARAKRIAIVDVVTNDVTYINIMHKDFRDFYNLVEISENRVLLFPINVYRYVYILSLDTFELIEQYIDYPNDLFNNKQQLILGNAYINGKAIFSLDGTDYLIVYDLKKNLVEIEKSSYKSHYIVGKNEVISLGAKKNELYINNELVYFSEHSFFPMKYFEEIGCVLVPEKHGNIIIVHRNVMMEYAIDWEKIDFDDKGSVFGEVIIIDNYLFLFPVYGNSIIKININSGKVNYLYMHLKIHDIIKVRNEEYLSALRNVLVEEEEMIYYFLETISQDWE